MLSEASLQKAKALLNKQYNYIQEGVSIIGDALLASYTLKEFICNYYIVPVEVIVPDHNLWERQAAYPLSLPFFPFPGF